MKRWPIGTGDGETMPAILRVPANPRRGMFGWTRRNDDGTPKFHGGIDILCPIGTPVYAAHAGKVTRAGWEDSRQPKKGHGMRVYIHGYDGATTVYSHLNQIAVKVGNSVYMGQLIGTSGKTGNASLGPSHLHFEVWANTRNDSRVDPIWWLTGEGTKDGYPKNVPPDAERRA